MESRTSSKAIIVGGLLAIAAMITWLVYRAASDPPGSVRVQGVGLVETSVPVEVLSGGPVIFRGDFED